MTCRDSFLDKVKEIVTTDRERTHGDYESCASEIAHLWSIYTGHLITSRDVSVMMILLKIARYKAGGDFDNILDIAGYAALLAEEHAEAEE